MSEKTDSAFASAPSGNQALERLHYEISNMPRYGLQWEWIAESAAGDLLNRDEVLALIEKHIKQGTEV